MENWSIALIALIVLGWVTWQWRLARQQTQDMRQQLAALRPGLEKAQAESSELRARQDALGTAMAEPLLVLDRERHIAWANAAAQSALGPAALGAAEGKPLIQVTRSHELEELIAEAVRAQEPLDRSVIFNGQPHMARAVPLAGGGAGLLLRDTSELQRLGRARRDFVANISHDLRTPLASIRLLVDTLQAGALSNPAIANEMLSKINVEVGALSQLAQELLDLALIESGQMPLKLAPTEMRGLAQAQIERFAPQAVQRRLALSADVPDGLCALADADMVKRVLANLLHNALKFTPAGGQITVLGRRDGDNVIVSVADTGPGLPQEALGRIFERFYKVDRARGQSGTGLGLAIARHIVEGHGGRIWAESELGHGAIFYFTLPAG